MNGLPWFHRKIIVAVNEQDRDCVRHVQRVLEVPVTGEMDPPTKLGLIGVQMLFDLPASGAIDEDTARQIERLRRWETL